MIGIHIRQGDHEYAKKNSPMELFMLKMDELITEDPRVCFFVASDDKNILEKMKCRYPQKVFYYENKEWNRYSYQGQIDAAVELLCLSRTKLIYGSVSSTYSAVAAEIGNIEKIVLKIENEIGRS
jgi:formylmethanofuran dehydrogenase subunit B